MSPLGAAAVAPASRTGAKRWLPLVALGLATSMAVALAASNGNREELNWLQKLAADGNAGAEIQLGMAYRDGRYGLAPDEHSAFYWFKQAADTGDAYAEDLVAGAYAHGTGTAPDTALAVSWWQKAARDGFADARLHLGEALIASGNRAAGEKLLRTQPGSLMPQPGPIQFGAGV